MSNLSVFRTHGCFGLAFRVMVLLRSFGSRYERWQPILENLGVPLRERGSTLRVTFYLASLLAIPSPHGLAFLKQLFEDLLLMNHSQR